MKTLLLTRRASCGFHLLVVTVALICCQVASAGEKRNAQDGREAVKRAVPFIENAEADWIANKECISCHHTAFAVWSLNKAKRQGIPINDGKLREWTDWTADWRNMMATAGRSELKRDITTSNQCDTVAQLLLASAPGKADVKPPQWFVQYVSDLKN